MARVRNKGTEVLDLDKARIVGKVKNRRLKSTFMVFLAKTYGSNDTFRLVGLDSIPITSLSEDGTIIKQPVDGWVRGRHECLNTDLIRLVSNYKFVKVGDVTYQVENKKSLLVKVF